MARKNPFANVMSGASTDDDAAILTYTNKGASKALINSLDELTAQADRLLAGETVVELDPATVDQSFIRDRLEDDQADFEELVNAIRERGQDSPILVRPHPSVSGRYMVVFGHRRLKAAKALNRNVRAVVKQLSDDQHIVAQGQENAARANLSFIEKAMFAADIARRQLDGDNAIVLSALAIDRSTLSKMLSVANIPVDVLDAVGAAKGVGRDRWYDLKACLERPSHLEKAKEYIQTDEFKGKVGDERFNSLLAFVKTIGKASRVKSAQLRKWASDDKTVSVEMKGAGRSYTLSLKSANAAGFGEFLGSKLSELYQEYQVQKHAQGK